MIDYAHNADGMLRLQEYMRTVNASEKIGIIACPGDRRDEDMENIGRLAAGMFDRIIIKHDKDGRGRTNDSITRLLRKGIDMVNRSMEVEVISDELEAISWAMEHARHNAFIAVCTDEIQASLRYLEEIRDKESVPVISLNH
jgi:cyanophycin synthetase